MYLVKGFIKSQLIIEMSEFILVIIFSLGEFSNCIFLINTSSIPLIYLEIIKFFN